MRLDLRSILHVPGASLPFSFALDLSGLDFEESNGRQSQTIF